jgi:putative membrane fusion protein
VAAINTAYLAGRAVLERAVGSATVTEGNVEVTLKGEALLLRREAVLVAPASGLWQVKTKAGERVSAGSEIGEILDPVLLERGRALKEEAEGERAAWQSGVDARLKRVEEELAQVTGDIQGVIETLRSGLYRPAQGLQTRRLEEMLNKLVARRAQLQAEQARLAEEAARGGAWKEKTREAEQLLRSASTPVVAPVPGAVFFVLDGWEEAFDPLQSRAALTLSEPKGAVLATPVPSGEKVAAGQILAKVVQDEPTFCKVLLKGASVAAPNIGDDVEVAFPAYGVRVSARVTALQEREADTTMLLELKNSPPALAQERTAQVEVTVRRLRGLLVPEKALVQEGSRIGVYVRRSSRWQFEPVEILLARDGQVLVKGLKAGEEIAVGWRP